MTVPVRVQRKRTKGWTMPPNTVSVCRPGRWGNPFKVAPGFEADGIRIPEITATSAVQLYREYVERALANWPSTRDALAELRGKNLACWCSLCRVHAAGKPLGVSCNRCDPCHSDVLLDLANRPRCEVVT